MVKGTYTHTYTYTHTHTHMTQRKIRRTETNYTEFKNT